MNALFDNLRPERQSEVIKYAALHVAKNSKLFELTAHGGNYQQYLKLALAIARSGAPDAEDIFVEAASIAKEAKTRTRSYGSFLKIASAPGRASMA